MSRTERERELLESLKQSEIAGVVTHGLNPDVPMKDSGIPWIGMIPRHWEVKRISSIIRFGKGLPITKADLQDDGIPVISYGQIHSKENISISLKNSLLRYVSPQFLESNKQCLLNENDFVFADTSEDIEGSGNFVLNDKPFPVFAGYHTIIVRLISNEFKPKYLASFMHSTGFRSQIRTQVDGVKVFSITKQIIKNTLVIFPPLSEQQAIVDYIEARLSRIDAYIADLQAEIDYLKEFKQRLVSDVVTGQICVAEPQKGKVI